MAKHHFFAYLFRMKHLRRWPLMRSSVEEDVAQHSHQVAMVAHALALYKNLCFGGGANPDRAAALALYHEAPEVITGDIATPIKYASPELRASFGVIEALAAKKLHATLPEGLREAFRGLLLEPENDPEWQRVKAADTICAYIKCIEEVKAGNAEFSRAEKETRQKVEAIGLPEAKRFLEECLPSFGLTIDEME
ncbi:MAG: 5'-deoxynucleotidase [Christensenellaceae bacterium]|jgi:5'-deoxynucleotidase|nr:5'-deoxynucleotidase [Christensenellaceae bacterium]